MFVYKCFDYFFRQFLLGVVVIYCFSDNTRSLSLPSNFVLRPGGNKEKEKSQRNESDASTERFDSDFTDQGYATSTKNPKNTKQLGKENLFRIIFVL